MALPPASHPSGVSGTLLRRAKAGDTRALSELFRLQGNKLRRWAAGRLPQWARGLYDTADLVQETLLQTFRRIDVFEHRGTGALQAYLRQAVMNRIRDEVRKVGRRPLATELETSDIRSPQPLPDQVLSDHEQEERYKAALALLTETERMLVVGRIELQYSFEQLALITDKPTPGAARVALRRAVLKLTEIMAALERPPAATATAID
jgi:RNA polymerase sigma factor (sigma-70 family)